MIALFKSFLVELVCFRFYLKSFFLDGHGTKYKKCMGTQNPRFIPLMGTVPSTKYCWAPGSCPSIKILSKSVGHGSLGGGSISRGGESNDSKYIMFDTLRILITTILSKSFT